jgi:phosphoglycolate phosphatase-like HAD superfamily hydrolase
VTQRPPGSIPAPRALAFDLDGTLVDSRLDIADACNFTRVARGLEPLPLERILPMIGDGARALVARAFDAPDTSAVVDEALATFKARYLAHPCVHTTLLPGAREALAVDLPRALVTNKPHDVTLLLLDALGIGGAFTVVWGGGDGPLKPAPDGVVHAAARLGVEARDLWMIGDGPQDVLAGKAAGAVTVAIPGMAETARLLAAGPDLVVGSLVELVAEIRARRA